MTRATHDEAEPGAAEARSAPKPPLRDRLHSLSGVAPLGLFVVAHLYTNAQALYGREDFELAQGATRSIPMLAWVEAVVIYAPLLFHALYGLALAVKGSGHSGRYGHVGRWMYLLQRVTGVAAFAFIALHAWQFRVQQLLGAARWQDDYALLGALLNRPEMFAAYLLGLSATVFHLATGLWLFGNTWGLTVSARAMRRSAVACGIAGMLLWAIGFNTLLHFSYRCGGVLPLPGLQADRACRDADTALPY